MSYDKATKHFVVEESTLRANNARGASFGQVYNDACDEGIKLVSHVTGKESFWYVNEVKKDNEGDIQVWIMQPTRESLREFPQLAGVEIHVLND